MDNSLKKAIKKTISYAQFFDYDLTRDEIHHWLITNKIIPKKNLSSKISNTLTKKRKQRRITSKDKIKQAQKLAFILNFIPTINMVAITGSLSMDNAKVGDDIDLMIVTKDDTLWLTRPLVILLITLFFKRRLPGSNTKTHFKDTFCTNLWLEQSSLKVPKTKHNLYTAHEVLQVRPILDKHHTYLHFISQNSWVKGFLANAFASHQKPKQPHPTSIVSTILKPLNLLAFNLQYQYMLPKITTESVNLHSAYFHPRDLSKNLT